MSSTRVAIIVGGLILSSSLLLLLVQIVLASGEPVPHIGLRGQVAIGGQTAVDGLEVRAQAFDVVQDQLVRLSLTDASVDDGKHLIQDGTYGELRVFQVPADSETPERGAKPLERLNLFIVVDDDEEVEARMTDESGGLIAGGIPFEPSTPVVDLSLFGAPTNVTIDPPTPSNEPLPTFRWEPPPVGDVDLYEVAIVDLGFSKEIDGALTTFTPDQSDFAQGIPDGIHTFQVRAVELLDSQRRRDIPATLVFEIDTKELVRV